MDRYLRALRHRDYALLWSGATISTLGDGMTQVALIWLVYELTGSAVAIGLLTAALTAPVLVGGVISGLLLDRFDRRLVLGVDTALRAAVMGSVPLLHWLDRLPVWYLFVVAVSYGLLKMIPLAGVPAMIPSLVDEADVTTANAMETISYALGGIVGPALAGILIGVLGAPAVIGIDALTYLAFLAALVAMRSTGSWRATGEDAGRPEVRHDAPSASVGLRPAIRLFAASPPILATTLMFMAFNVGEGVMMVVLPLYVAETLRLDAVAYGSILAAFSGGILVGAVAVGGLPTPRRTGRAIAIAQIGAGLVLAGLIIQPPVAVSAALLAGFGLAASPLTIWAQTIRMRHIPAELRGRMFALLRTMMQATPPIGGLAAGLLMDGPGVSVAIAAGVVAILLPGLAGLAFRGLQEETLPVAAGGESIEVRRPAPGG